MQVEVTKTTTSVSRVQVTTTVSALVREVAMEQIVNNNDNSGLTLAYPDDSADDEEYVVEEVRAVLSSCQLSFD